MKRLIGTTSSGGQFMTSGFSHVLIAGKDVSIRWDEPIAVLRADRLRLAGVTVSASRKVAKVRVVHLRVE
jgi:hypothetical protein